MRTEPESKQSEELVRNQVIHIAKLFSTSARGQKTSPDHNPEMCIE